MLKLLQNRLSNLLTDWKRFQINWQNPIALSKVLQNSNIKQFNTLKNVMFRDYSQ